MLKEYILQNWSLTLILLAFAVLLRTTVFLNKKTIRRMYALILGLFLFSVIVFWEFYLEDHGGSVDTRLILMAVRYSATPIIIAMIICTLANDIRWFVSLPAFGLTILDFISIPTGIIFGLDAEGKLQRGVLGYLPYTLVGAYSILLVYILVKRCNRRATEIFPILFLCFAFMSGMILPFMLGKDYSKIFCVTIVIALFVYYVFSILQMTDKDPLTGLLNRQAFYASVGQDAGNVRALVSIDMNGLKTINDTGGHDAGDRALMTVSRCFQQAVTARQMAYRIGGDEFMIVCSRGSEKDVKDLIGRVHRNLSGTGYTRAIGYSFCQDGSKTLDEMIKESDEQMYTDKDHFYSNHENKNRKRRAGSG